MNIFVGNLAFTTTEQDLRQLFEPYGSVETIRIMTDRETVVRGVLALSRCQTTAQRRRPLTPSTARPWPAAPSRSMKHGRASRARAPSLCTTTALPSSRHALALGRCAQGRFGAVYPASSRAPDMGGP